MPSMKALLVGLGPTALTALESLHETLDVVGLVRNVYPAHECEGGDPAWSPRDLDNWVPGTARRADH